MVGKGSNAWLFDIGPLVGAEFCNFSKKRKGIYLFFDMDQYDYICMKKTSKAVFLTLVTFSMFFPSKMSGNIVIFRSFKIIFFLQAAGHAFRCGRARCVVPQRRVNRGDAGIHGSTLLRFPMKGGAPPQNSTQLCIFTKKMNSEYDSGYHFFPY